MRMFAMLMATMMGTAACIESTTGRGGGAKIRNPIDVCPELDVDCCETNGQCSDFFGKFAPFCRNPGPRGICGECQGESGCEAGEVCAVDDDAFAVCVPDHGMAQGPWSERLPLGRGTDLGRQHAGPSMSVHDGAHRVRLPPAGPEPGVLRARAVPSPSR